MRQPRDSAVSPAPPANCIGGRWLYPLLLAIQTIGAVILCWKGIPLYRVLVADPAAYETREEILVWALTAIMLIQTGYWLRYRIGPALPRFVNTVLGHVVLFVSRLSFVVATSIFSFVFIAKKLEAQMSVSRYVLTIVGLFSLFCYMLELERLGKALIGSERRPATRSP